MTTINHFAKSEVAELTGDSLLKESVVMLNGVNSEMVIILRDNHHIETIFDLATSRDFNTILKMVPSRNDLKNGYQNFGTKGFIPKDVLPNGLDVPIDKLPHLALSNLTFIEEWKANALASTFSITTIQEMAYWPPFQAAIKILQETFSLNDSAAYVEDEEKPHDLIPASGDYPIEKVFYKKYFLDTIGNINQANDGERIPMSSEESVAMLKLAEAELERVNAHLPVEEQRRADAQQKVKQLKQKIAKQTTHHHSFKKYHDDLQKSKSYLSDGEINAFCELIQSERLYLIIEETEGMDRFLMNESNLASESTSPVTPSDELIKKWKKLINLELKKAEKMYKNSNDNYEKLQNQLKELKAISKEANTAYFDAIKNIDYATSEVERLENNEEESKKYVHLEKTGPINLLDSDNLRNGFEEPAVGVEVIAAQSWYVEGVALGQLLHSLALAPGESTRIAIVDWHRKESSITQEMTTQDESLRSNSNRDRAISEVTEATSREMQEGQSTGFSRGGSSQQASNVSGGFIIASGGSSQSSSSNWGFATNVSRTEGARSVAAETVQNINDSIHQNASSSRTRRAAIVQETFQSESEKVTTRVITNYNHMHAMSVQYYEVVQIYKVKTEVQDMNRILYLPMKYFDFYDTRVINRFQSKLARMAITPRIRYLLEAFNDKHVLHFKMPHITTLYNGRLNAEVQKLENELQQDKAIMQSKTIELIAQITAKTAELAALQVAGILGGNQSALKEAEKEIRELHRRLAELKSELRKKEHENRTAIYQVRKKYHGLKQSSIKHVTEQSDRGGRILRTAIPKFQGEDTLMKSLDGELRLEEINFGEQTASQGYKIKNLTIHPYPEGTDPIIMTSESGSFKLDQVDNPLQDIHNVTIVLENPIKKEADLVGIPATITFRTESDKSIKIKYEFVPTVDATEIEFLAVQHPVVSDELQNHLMDYDQYYSMMVWYQMNSMEYSQLLANVTYKGRKIASFLDPKPVAITGNYIGFRWHFANETERLDFENLYKKKTGKADVTIPLPSGGVFAEAVLGRFNSAEKLDMSRFWNWQDSPIPILPPEIAAVQTGSRNANTAPLPANLEAQSAQLQRMQALPDPTGMSSAMNALTMANMFRDMSGSQNVAAMVSNAQQVANQGATSAGEINAENMANFQEYQSGLIKAYMEHTQKMAEVAAPLAMGAATGGAGLAASSLSKAGAVMNMASSLDKSNGSENGQSNKKSAFQSLIGSVGSISGLMQKAKGIVTKKKI